MLGAALQAQDQPAPRRDQAIELAGRGRREPPAGVQRRRADSCLGAAQGRQGLAARAARRRVHAGVRRAGTVSPRHDAADSARQPSGRAGLRLRDRADAGDAAGPRGRADGVRRSPSRARAVRVDRAQPRARGLRRSAGPVGRRVLQRARTDRASRATPQFRRRAQLLSSCISGARTCRRRCRRSRARSSAFRAA